MKKRGLVCVLKSNHDRVESSALGCWLRVVGDGGARRVRLSEGELGERLVPTDEERAERAVQLEREIEALRAELAKRG